MLSTSKLFIPSLSILSRVKPQKGTCPCASPPEFHGTEFPLSLGGKGGLGWGRFPGQLQICVPPWVLLIPAAGASREQSEGSRRELEFHVRSSAAPGWLLGGVSLELPIRLVAKGSGMCCWRGSGSTNCSFSLCQRLRRVPAAQTGLCVCHIYTSRLLSSSGSRVLEIKAGLGAIKLSPALWL